jgi:hypothetical protein
MITGRRVRAARALLNWTQDMLAEKAFVALTALKRVESERGLRCTRAHAIRCVARSRVPECCSSNPTAVAASCC